MKPSEQSSRLRELFDRAMELPTEQRAAFVQCDCGQDRKLCMAVLELLAAHERAGDFLGDPTIPPDLFEAPDAFAPGTRVARYTIVRLIGEGGCGAVYVADEDPPLRRQVALKVIRPGLDSRQFVARFELERQLLVMMDHPNIARILDAGSTENGSPYFVMELVDGRPVTEFCRDFDLTIAERLDLFVTVCDAVHHAHLRGILHRDLKPANVLVAMRDGNPIPKVIDFGISQAMGDSLEAAALAGTGDSHFLGTPQYMSPEQAALRHDTDAHTDVYSLGALLYELLSRLPPFDPSRLAMLTYEQMRQVLMEEVPAAPSKIQKSGSRTWPRELDEIVLKALKKDRAQRQPAADALAADVSRCLDRMRAPFGRSRANARSSHENSPQRVIALAAILITLVASIAIYMANRRRGFPADQTIRSSILEQTVPASQAAEEAVVPGLIAELYQGSKFDVLIAKRVDAEIHFVWEGNASPDRRIAPPRYSIRWTGIIVIPPGGVRGMVVRADDGARLFIDGNLLLDFSRPSTRASHVPISAGRHSIRVDYWNRLIHGDVSLFWLTGDSDASARLVPASALAHSATERPDL